MVRQVAKNADKEPVVSAVVIIVERRDILPGNVQKAKVNQTVPIFKEEEVTGVVAEADSIEVVVTIIKSIEVVVTIIKLSTQKT